MKNATFLYKTGLSKANVNTNGEYKMGVQNGPTTKSRVLPLQWNLSKADTYGTEVFVRFREVSALERLKLKGSQI